VGVHGDWGAGKSTVLSLVERELHARNGVATLWFNGWEYEGFEDAKIAILEGIVRQLQENKIFFGKAKAWFKKLRKRIDYMKLARSAVVGGAGLVAAGPAGLALMLPALLDLNKAGERFDAVASVVKEEGDPEDPLDLAGFRRDFQKMLEKTGIEQLVVLVDDLDRCLPKTAIGTLEAIRLFMANQRTVFVLACDRSMIEYAVRDHFPARPGMRADEYARNYLDKLIQIPFTLPVLGPLEVAIYVQLLLLEGVLGGSSPAFGALLSQAKAISQKPWLDQQLDMTAVQAELSKNESLKELRALMLGVAPVLASGTDGNPRQIKRFLNSAFVRRRAAEARGLAKDVKIAPLMKLMLAEYFHSDLFDAIAAESRNGTANKLIQQLESIANRHGEIDDSKGENDASQDDSVRVDFANDPRIIRWAALEPRIAEADLRPYLFVIRDARLVSGSTLPAEVAELLGLIAQGKSLLAKKNEVQKLTPESRGLLAAELATRLTTASDATRHGPVAKGIKDLMSLDDSISGIVDRAFITMPISLIGPWISELTTLTKSGQHFKVWLQRALSEGVPKPIETLIQVMLKP
jgi:predicted KAP-like P-loop ATPase